MQYRSINPFTGKLNGEYDLIDDQILNLSLEKAEVAFDNWRLSPINFRTDRLLEIASLLKERESELANLITAEMGKPIHQAKAQNVSNHRPILSSIKFLHELGKLQSQGPNRAW